MLKQFLKEVVTVVVGKQAEEIAELLDSNKYVNEFLIAKKMGITINQARNILYKLSDHGLVSSIRKKDKKKGWYTYFWKIESVKSLEFLKNILIKQIGQLNNQMKSRETKTFYVCERCNVEFNEENALINAFTCNECGNVFVVSDNMKILKEYKRNLEKLKKELALIEEDISKEKEKIEKKKLKEAKKLKTVTEVKGRKKAVKTKEKKQAKKPKKKKVIKKESKKKIKKVVGVKAKKKSLKKKKVTNKKAVKTSKSKVKKKKR